MIPYGRQDISDADCDAVMAVLRSDFLTQGPAVPAFEAAICQAVGAPHCVAVNSATSALHIAYLALGLGPGDALWTSPNTFLATSNAALYCGADVDFVDIDAQTLNLSATALEIKLERARSCGAKLPKIVVPVHFGGEPCDMAKVAALAGEYGFAVVEDASHAIGGTYRGSRIGDCTFSDMAVFSFHPVKIITTGEGGAVVAKNADLVEKLKLLRSHGMTREKRLMRCKSDAGWYYEQTTLGFNYRMTDIQAALGVSQMARLESYIAAREERADIYDRAFAQSGISIQSRSAQARSSLHLYVLRWPRDARILKIHAFDSLKEHGIGVNLHYMPVYLQPFYADIGFKPGHCPAAEAYYEQAITIPLHPRLTRSDQNFIIDHVLELAETAR